MFTVGSTVAVPVTVIPSPALTSVTVPDPAPEAAIEIELPESVKVILLPATNLTISVVPSVPTSFMSASYPF